MNSFGKIAITTVLNVVLSGPALAAEPDVAGPVFSSAGQTTVIDITRLMDRHAEFQLTIPETSGSVIVIARPAREEPDPACEQMLLVPQATASDLDDFGGPFGWQGKPLMDPTIAIRSITIQDLSSTPYPACN